MIVAHRFSERAGGMGFASADNPAFFGVVVCAHRHIPARCGFTGTDRGVIGFVPKPEGGGLFAATGRSQGAVGIPMDRAGLRIVRIVVVRIQPQMDRMRLVFQPMKYRSFEGVLG